MVVQKSTVSCFFVLTNDIVFRGGSKPPALPLVAFFAICFTFFTKNDIIQYRKAVSPWQRKMS